MPLQHFPEPLYQPGCLRRERALRVQHIADLKKRLASVDGQRFDIILLIGAVHKIQAQTTNIRVEQKIDDPFDLIKSGLNITFIPSAILPMEQDQSINEASSLFESWFTNENPTMIQFCMSLLMQLVLYERPFDQEDKDPYQLAKGICRLVYDAMQKSD